MEMPIGSEQQPPAKKSSKNLRYVVAGVSLIVVVIAGILSWNAYQDWSHKRQEIQGSFQTTDFDSTARWLALQRLEMDEAEYKRNEMIVKEASQTLLGRLKAVEGSPVKWQMIVQGVSDKRLHVRDLYSFNNKGQVIWMTISIGDGKGFGGFTIDGQTISVDHAKRLKADDSVTVSGKIDRCFAEKSAGEWKFRIVISEATIN